MSTCNHCSSERKELRYIEIRCIERVIHVLAGWKRNNTFHSGCTVIPQSWTRPSRLSATGHSRSVGTALDCLASTEAVSLASIHRHRTLNVRLPKPFTFLGFPLVRSHGRPSPKGELLHKRKVCGIVCRYRHLYASRTFNSRLALHPLPLDFTATSDRTYQHLCPSNDGGPA